MPYIEMSPQDAAALGFANGDMASVYNEKGNGVFTVYVTDAVPNGMLFAIMYHWLGTANSLTSPYTDEMSTNPWYKGTRVAVRKLAGPIQSIVETTSFLPTNTFA